MGSYLFIYYGGHAVFILFTSIRTTRGQDLGPVGYGLVSLRLYLLRIVDVLHSYRILFIVFWGALVI